MQTKYLFVFLHIRNKGEVGDKNMFKPSSIFFTDRTMAVILLWILFVICVSCLSDFDIHSLEGELFKLASNKRSKFYMVSVAE